MGQVAEARARARRHGLEATLSETDWQQTVQDYGGRCAYCGAAFETLDHFLPLSSGQAGTTVKNCVPACLNCNLLKGDRLPDQVEEFPTEVIERVSAYLALRVATEPVLPPVMIPSKAEKLATRRREQAEIMQKKAKILEKQAKLLSAKAARLQEQAQSLLAPR